MLFRETESGSVPSLPEHAADQGPSPGPRRELSPPNSPGQPPLCVFPGGWKRSQRHAACFGGNTRLYGPVDRGSLVRPTEHGSPVHGFLFKQERPFLSDPENGAHRETNVGSSLIPADRLQLPGGKTPGITDTAFDGSPASGDVCTGFPKNKGTEPDKCQV